MWLDEGVFIKPCYNHPHIIFIIQLMLLGIVIEYLLFCCLGNMRALYVVDVLQLF